jgi:hypothetical protein
LVELGLAIVAALGTIATAYVGVIAARTRATVNGRMEELLHRVALLEELLAFARTQPAELGGRPPGEGSRPGPQLRP